MLSRNPILRRAEQQYSEEYSGPGFAALSPAGPTAPGSPAGPGQGVAPAASSAPAASTPAAAGPLSAVPATGGTDDLERAYARTAVDGGSSPVMTITDVIMKSAASFGVLVVFAAATWFVTAGMPLDASGNVSGGVIGIMFGAMILGLILGLVNAFKREVSPGLIIAYAAVQGVFLGAISYFYQIFGQQFGMGNIVATAVVATLIVFATMLTLYRTRIIRVTNKFRKIVMIALISYVAFAFINLIFAWIFGFGNGFGIYGSGWIGIAVSAGAIILASLVLTLDFDSIEQALTVGVPEKESWRMAFGLMVTLIWLYLEILRFLALIAMNRE